MSRSQASDTRLGVLLALLLLAVNIASVWARLGTPLHKPKQVKETDQWRYIEMSRGERGRDELRQEPPFCYRVAIPLLVRGLVKLGLSENAAFFAQTNAALFGFLLLLWIHLRDLGFSTALRATGLLVTGFTQGAVRWFEYQYWMTDPAALFLVMLGFFLVERRRPIGLALTGLAAAFVRETYVLIHPYVLLHDLRCRLAAAAPPNRGDGSRRIGDALLAATTRAVLIAAPWLAATLILRSLIVPNQADSFVAGVVENMAFRWNHRWNNQLYVIGVGSFGVLVPLVLLFPRLLPRLAVRHFDRALFVLAVYSTLSISNNNERPLAYALPALVPAALGCLRIFLASTRLPALPVLSAVVGLQVLFWWGQRFGESGSSIYQPVNWTTLSAMGLAWLAAQALLRRATAQPEPTAT